MEPAHVSQSQQAAKYFKRRREKKNNQNFKNEEEEIIIPKLKETQNNEFKHVVNGTAKFPSYLDNLPYVEGQWSVTNQTGKKVYSILFLSQLGREVVCQKKPDVLKNWSTKSFIAPQFSSLSDILKQQEKKKNKKNKHYSKNEEEQSIIPKPVELVQQEEPQYNELQHVVNDTLKFPSYLDNLPYVEGQWSVTNQTGKKVYSILFLSQLGREAVCQKKPDVLKNWRTKSFIAPKYNSLSHPSVILNRSHGELLKLKETVEHPLNSVVAYKMNMKCKSILVDYEELNNLNEIIYSLSEDESSVIRTRHKEFVKSMSLIILDCPITQTTVAGTIFAELLSKKILSMEAITQGIDDVLKYWNDFLMYYPQFFSSIAAIIAPLLLQNTCFDFNNLKDSCTSIRPDNSSKLFTEVLYKMNSSKETQNVKEQLGGILWIYNKWNMSENVPLDVFMPNNQINKYFKKDQVGVFLLSIAMYDKIKLTDNKLLYDILRSWICTNISAEIIKSPLFVRALTVAIVIVCLQLNRSYKDFFDHVHVKLLTHYIKLKPLPKNQIQAREVQCMFGIQIMSATLEHPRGMVLKLFNKLHQDKVISKESFELFIQEYEKIAEK